MAEEPSKAPAASDAEEQSKAPEAEEQSPDGPSWKDADAGSEDSLLNDEPGKEKAKPLVQVDEKVEASIENAPTGIDNEEKKTSEETTSPKAEDDSKDKDKIKNKEKDKADSKGDGPPIWIIENQLKYCPPNWHPMWKATAFGMTPEGQEDK